jgi:hypothetical protein
MERVIDPILADVQAEYGEALRAGRWWRATWVCVSGYLEFWKAVGLYTLQSGPRLRNAIAADGWSLGRMSAYSLVASVVVTILLSAPPMIGSSSRFGLTLTLLLMPQAIALSIPIAVPLGIVFGEYDTRVSARRIRGVLLLAIVGTLLAFAAMLILPIANDAYRVGIAEDLRLRGVTYSLPKGATELSLSELASRSDEYDAGGFFQNSRDLRRAYQMRLALPAATFVLSLLAVGICGTVRARGARAVAIVIAIALYWASLAVAEWSPILPPVLSVWAPNIVFAAASLIFLRPLRDPGVRP